MEMSSHRAPYALCDKRETMARTKGHNPGKVSSEQLQWLKQFWQSKNHFLASYSVKMPKNVAPLVQCHFSNVVGFVWFEFVRKDEMRNKSCYEC